MKATMFRTVCYSAEMLGISTICAQGRAHSMTRPSSYTWSVCIFRTNENKVILIGPLHPFRSFLFLNFMEKIGFEGSCNAQWRLWAPHCKSTHQLAAETPGDCTLPKSLQWRQGSGDSFCGGHRGSELEGVSLNDSPASASPTSHM